MCPGRVSACCRVQGPGRVVRGPDAREQCGALQGPCGGMRGGGGGAQGQGSGCRAVQGLAKWREVIFSTRARAASLQSPPLLSGRFPPIGGGGGSHQVTVPPLKRGGGGVHHKSVPWYHSVNQLRPCKHFSLAPSAPSIFHAFGRSDGSPPFGGGVSVLRGGLAVMTSVADPCRPSQAERL